VTRIRWTQGAASDLLAIERPEYRWRVAHAVRGLAQFPQRGRIPPELEKFEHLQFPAELREIIFPRLARMFYLHDRSKNVIHILGLAFRGQDVTQEWLQALLRR